MNLKELGFDGWFENHTRELFRPEMKIARVTAVDRGRYMVTNEKGEIPAQLTGKFSYAAESSEELPCVGDWILTQDFDSEDFAFIHKIIPRKSFLRRKSPGKDIEFQMIASNIDIAFIVQSCDDNFNVRRMERYLVMVKEGNIEPMIILTKTDMIKIDILEQMISQVWNAGISSKIIPLSNISGDGTDQIRRVLKAGKTHCLIGSSGVGKTTLINTLLGRPEYKTKPVGETGKGKHTTVRRQLITLGNGAMLIDTPGMRELGIMSVDGRIDDCFAEIKRRSAKCRFDDCGHTNEPGCAVLKAVEDGELEKESYHNYLKLKKESEFYEMSYTEKRKKDKAFGRFIHSEMKKRGKNR
ncbi:ribosome small subunit-dependent GTPase A [candidate division LCP-89 bacterium B3_LCP]|uniref:Small ribosomal subunit biogenesis GTPase RsgA n=1 Tax=candidate division LCP-89 bacterium B3_LCP TaxID=2012998 RepID=A0A532UYG1_UNCL8|nr:MAG: ribosome small subunit-dependent GTPase A [candidate division LCP-89 bacterium B3_LCP]